MQLNPEKQRQMASEINDGIGSEWLGRAGESVETEEEQEFISYVQESKLRNARAADEPDWDLY